MATRVPLIIKAPDKPQSHGKHTVLFAELVDLYKTVAALAGTTAPIQSTVDGVSLQAAFDDPTIVKLAVPTGEIDYTYEKTVAFSQYPGQHFGHCDGGYVHGGVCKNVSVSAGKIAVGNNPLVDQTVTYMGFSVRSHDWRYTVWMPATQNTNDTTKPALVIDWAASASSALPAP